MRHPILPLVAAALAFATTLRAQAAPPASSPATPSPPHERLTFFEGEWTIDELPPARAFRERCAWMDGGRRHMVCRSRSMSASGAWREGLSMFSFRPADSTYVYYGLRSGGATQQLVGGPSTDGEGWDFRGEEGTGPARVRTLVRIFRLPEGRFRFIEQTARGDAAFAGADTIHYRPAQPMPGPP